MSLPTEQISVYLAAFGLVLARSLAAFIVVPVTGAAPARLKVAAAAAVAVALTPVAALHSPPGPIGLTTYLALVGKHLLFGLLVGLVAAIFIQVAELAGGVLDAQIGFNVAEVFDPASGTRSSAITQAHYIIAALLFLLVNGHHWLIVGIGDSFRHGGWEPPEVSRLDLARFLKATGPIIYSAVRIAAPGVAALFLADLSLAIAVRASPQANVFIVGAPLKILVGLAIIGLAIPVVAAMILSLIAEARGWLLILSGA
ncbi:MAG: flagellar biosynthetic protein FliR [Armatimonadota bacterium]